MAIRRAELHELGRCWDMYTEAASMYGPPRGGFIAQCDIDAKTCSICEKLASWQRTLKTGRPFEVHPEVPNPLHSPFDFSRTK